MMHRESYKLGELLMEKTIKGISALSRWGARCRTLTASSKRLVFDRELLLSPSLVTVSVRHHSNYLWLMSCTYRPHRVLRREPTPQRTETKPKWEVDGLYLYQAQFYLFLPVTMQRPRGTENSSFNYQILLGFCLCGFIQRFYCVGNTLLHVAVAEISKGERIINVVNKLRPQSLPVLVLDEC